MTHLKNGRALTELTPYRPRRPTQLLRGIPTDVIAAVQGVEAPGCVVGQPVAHGGEGRAVPPKQIYVVPGVDLTQADRVQPDPLEKRGQRMCAYARVAAGRRWTAYPSAAASRNSLR